MPEFYMVLVMTASGFHLFSQYNDYESARQGFAEACGKGEFDAVFLMPLVDYFINQ